MTRAALVAVALTTFLLPACGPSKAEREAAERQRQEEIKAAHQAAMAEGEAMFEAHQWDQAIAAFQKAHDLIPGDAHTAERLAAAKAGREKLLTEKYEKALAAGREALAAKNYPDAQREFDLALTYRPDDPAAKAEREKVLAARYDLAMTAGREALAAQQYRDAQKAFDQALTFRPGDPEATTKRNLAEVPALVAEGKDLLAAKQNVAAIRKFQAARAKSPADMAIGDLLKQATDARRDEVRAEYDRAMAGGRDAMTRKQYAEAGAAFAKAAELVPGDEQAAAEKVSADFELHMRRGQDLMLAREYTKAKNEFAAALTLRPDERARELKGLAEQAEAKAKKEAEIAAAKEKNDRYDKLLSEGRSSMAFKQYKSAIETFKKAEAVGASGRSEATTARQQCEQVIRDYNSAIDKAKAAIRAKKKNDAIAAANVAAALIPGETEPTMLLAEANRIDTTKK